MSRPKKGTRGDELATAKWRKTMQEKYGGQEGLHQKMQEIGAIGGQNGHTGGFKTNLRDKNGLTGFERARIYGRIGGMKSRRTGVKNGEGKK